MEKELFVPGEARLAMRRGEWTGPTTYKVPGYVQCNLVALPKAYAYDFLVYCQRNRDACPIVDITDPGDAAPRYAAPDADLRTDLPKYRVFENGRLIDEPTDVTRYWREDTVGILIGSSLTFDEPLRRIGVELSPEVWVVETTIATKSSGPFTGPLIVTMRCFTPEDAIRAVQLTARFPWNHGAPIHIGDPEAIGANLGSPLVGPPVSDIPPGKIPVFWACGVTPQSSALNAGIEWMITHSPGHGFITDLQADRFSQP